MTTKATKAAPPTEAPLTAKERPEQETLQHGAEGLGVFRAILLTVLFYGVLGFVAWFAWNVYRQWLGH